MALNLEFGNLRQTLFGEFRRLTLAVKAASLPPAERQLADGDLCGQRGDGVADYGSLAPAPAPVAGEGMRVCRQPFNRDEGEFTCPYCGKHWPGA